MAGDDDIGIEVRPAAGDFDFGIGHEDFAAFASEVGFEGGGEVDGDRVVVEGAAGHGVGGAVEVFVFEGLLGFPGEVVAGGEALGGLAGSNHTGILPFMSRGRRRARASRSLKL